MIYDNFKSGTSALPCSTLSPSRVRGKSRVPRVSRFRSSLEGMDNDEAFGDELETQSEASAVWFGPGNVEVGCALQQPLYADVHSDQVQMLFLCEDSLGVL